LDKIGGFTLAADGFSKEYVGLSTKNLITYKGDLNYDGKVSFADLVYLNAGAAEYAKATSDATRKKFADVDANFDGKIDIADLSVLEKDWGKSLHSNNGTFTGSTTFGATTEAWKTAMKTFATSAGTNSSAWTNTAFEAENLVASNGLIAPLDTPTQTGVIGGVNRDQNTADVITTTPIASLTEALL